MENLSEILSTNTQMELDKVTYAIYVDYQSTLFPTKDKNEIAHGLLIKILALLYAQTKGEYLWHLEKFNLFVKEIRTWFSACKINVMLD